eukprot:9726963-Ditylum_brightwellii.AAC.1
MGLIAKAMDIGLVPAQEAAESMGCGTHGHSAHSMMGGRVRSTCGYVLPNIARTCIQWSGGLKCKRDANSHAPYKAGSEMCLQTHEKTSC